MSRERPNRVDRKDVTPAKYGQASGVGAQCRLGRKARRMSDTGAGWWMSADGQWNEGEPPPGWWQASDNRWYPPPPGPDDPTMASEPVEAQAAPRSGLAGAPDTYEQPRWRRTTY